jgi:hypothetical protein
MGALECWVSNTLLHYSITPVLQLFVGCSEPIERKEVHECHSAAHSKKLG